MNWLVIRVSIAGYGVMACEGETIPYREAMPGFVSTFPKLFTHIDLRPKWGLSHSAMVLIIRVLAYSAEMRDFMF
jgi:hypothetical protein